MHAFDIQFTGLKIGQHTYEFEVGKTFFDAFDFSSISDGDLVVTVHLEKQTNMMIANFSMSGTVETICDRCADAVFVSLEHEDRLIYKLEDHNFDDNEEVVVLDEGDDKFNIAEPIYQFIILSMPAKILHEEGNCNADAIEKLNNLSNKGKDDDDIDPRWSKLKDLN